MLKPLFSFAALSIAGSVVLSLLPHGSLRKTAAMVIGLLTMLCWAEGFLGLLNWTGGSQSDITVLMPTSVTLSSMTSAEAPE